MVAQAKKTHGLWWMEWRHCLVSLCFQSQAGSWIFCQMKMDPKVIFEILWIPCLVEQRTFPTSKVLKPLGTPATFPVNKPTKKKTHSLKYLCQILGFSLILDTPYSSRPLHLGLLTIFAATGFAGAKKSRGTEEESWEGQSLLFQRGEGVGVWVATRATTKKPYRFDMSVFIWATKKTLVVLGYIRDEILPSCIGISINHYKDPY